MAMVDVDGSSHLSADSQPKSVGLVWGLAATRRSVCIHQMNRVNSRSDHGHEESTINILVELLLLLLLLFFDPREKRGKKEIKLTSKTISKVKWSTTSIFYVFLVIFLLFLDSVHVKYLRIVHVVEYKVNVYRNCLYSGRRTAYYLESTFFACVVWCVWIDIVTRLCWTRFPGNSNCMCNELTNYYTAFAMYTSVKFTLL